MNEPLQPAWKKHLDSTPLDDEAFAAMKKQVFSLPALLLCALQGSISQKDTGYFIKKTKILIGDGDTVSAGGVMGALSHMEPDMVGTTESEWFKKASLLCKEAMNSIVARPLSDMRPFTAAEKTAVAQEKLAVFENLRITAEAVDSLFPPELSVTQKS